MLATILSIMVLVTVANATTEWWGDLRAHLNPPKTPAFYDVTYDENECPQGLRSDAIPEYVYFGTMIASTTVKEHEECLRKCVEKPRCKAVNYFHPFAYQEKGFCELLSETQKDNPRLMRPFRMATYYEKIRCRELDEDHVDEVQKPSPSHRENKAIMSNLMKKLSNKLHSLNPGSFRAARR